jgi:cell division septum initiation protein DivIVA
MTIFSGAIILFFHFLVDQVRSSVVTLERENIGLKQENASLKATLDQERLGRSTLEQKLVEAESQLISARVTLEGERGEIKRLKNQVLNIVCLMNNALRIAWIE